MVSWSCTCIKRGKRKENQWSCQNRNTCLLYLHCRSHIYLWCCTPSPRRELKKTKPPLQWRETRTWGRIGAHVSASSLWPLTSLWSTKSHLPSHQVMSLSRISFDEIKEAACGMLLVQVMLEQFSGYLWTQERLSQQRSGLSLSLTSLHNAEVPSDVVPEREGLNAPDSCRCIFLGKLNC